MTSPNSTAAKRRTKHPELLPRPDFPLSPHPQTQRWYKVIRRRRVYFGPLADPDAALDRYLDQKDDLYAGRQPRAGGDGVVLRDLVNGFLTGKQRLLDNGELKPTTFGEYYRVGKQLIEAFGPARRVDDLVADDFGQLRSSFAKTLGPAELGKRIQITRSYFKFAYDSGLVDRPVRYGPEFKRPAKKALRKVRKSKPPRLFDPDQLKVILNAASLPLKAMTLLGLNAAFGNNDCSELPIDRVDLEKGITDWPRPKTEIDRRCTLWTESIDAIKAAIKVRPAPKDPADKALVFITIYGHRWVRFQRRDEQKHGAAIDAVGLEFNKLLNKLKLKKPGVGFYALRHTFRTVADEVGDRPAIDLIMGHEHAGDMAVAYRERISVDRLQAVTDHVHAWLFGN